MKYKEIIKILLFPLLPALHNQVRKELQSLIKTRNRKQRILDIGGRKSPYTLGLNALVTIMDKPPSNTVQKSLNLGIDKKKLNDLINNRSNIEDIILHDITSEQLPIKNKFDIVIAIEVIEHVEKIEKMLMNVSGLLKPGGIVYMSTPNGDYIKNEPPNYNPDHVKHYKRNELLKLFSTHFSDIEVYYGIKMGKYWLNSGRSWTLRRPLELFNTFFSSVINQLESRGIENVHMRTAHLFIKAKKYDSK